jgi:hypothetical protein
LNAGVIVFGLQGRAWVATAAGEVGVYMGCDSVWSAAEQESGHVFATDLLGDSILREGKTLAITDCPGIADQSNWEPLDVHEVHVGWLEFVSILPDEHLVLSQVPQPPLSSVDEWLSRHGGSRPAGQLSHHVRNAPLR